MMNGASDTVASNFSAAWAVANGADCETNRGNGGADDAQLSQVRTQFEWQIRSKADELREMQARVSQLELETAQARNVMEMEKRKLMRQVGSYRSVLERYCIPPEEADAMYGDDDSPDGYNSNQASFEPATSSQWSANTMVMDATACQQQGNVIAALMAGAAPMVAAQMGGCQMASEEDQDSSLDSKMRQLNAMLQGNQAEAQDSEDAEGGEQASGEGSGSGNGYTSGAIASTLQAMFPHATIRTGRGEDERHAQENGNGQDLPAEAKEVEAYMKKLERSVDSQVDDRALASLQSLPPADAKEALRKVEELVQSQGGQCRNLSSILQSVCRKLEKRNKQPRAEDMRYPTNGVSMTRPGVSAMGSRRRNDEDADAFESSGSDGAAKKAPPAQPAQPAQLSQPVSALPTPTNLDTPAGKRSWADMGDYEDGDEEQVTTTSPIKEEAEEDPWTVALAEQIGRKGLELRANSDKTYSLKIQMAALEPPLTEVGLERYCNWLHDSLTAFREEHGEECLRRCNGEVDFSQNNLSNQMVWMLLETLAQHEVHAALIKLQANCISQGGILALCEYIRMSEAEAVQELHLSHNEIDDDSALELLRTLKTKPRSPVKDAAGMVSVPTWVRLNHNRIQNTGEVRRIAEAEEITVEALGQVQLNLEDSSNEVLEGAESTKGNRRKNKKKGEGKA